MMLFLIAFCHELYELMRKCVLPFVKEKGKQQLGVGQKLLVKDAMHYIKKTPNEQ